ncbi:MULTISPECIES: hypothetical protein [Sphingobacterium]|uniref:Lasso RiPP family leader peptide-containing protein n=1 Tax=Sphingobacterium tenebrionis TaxID=3111775 RepID=A0ABU8I8L6_9SPHI|nr:MULTISPECIES: hypothetical protein [unclassified Sphingobacterium]
MKNDERKDYIVPSMSVTHVELEQGIAAESVTASPNPSVGDWNEGTGGMDDNDL